MKQNFTQQHHSIEELRRIQLASVLDMIVFFTAGRLENREKAFNIELVGDHLALDGETKELLNVHATVLVTFGLVQLREPELLSLSQRYTVLGHFMN
jgi:hypothetical protein